MIIVVTLTHLFSQNMMMIVDCEQSTNCNFHSKQLQTTFKKGPTPLAVYSIFFNPLLTSFNRNSHSTSAVIFLLPRKKDCLFSIYNVHVFIDKFIFNRIRRQNLLTAVIIQLSTTAESELIHCWCRNNKSFVGCC